jgi:hypothetical protein
LDKEGYAWVSLGDFIAIKDCRTEPDNSEIPIISHKEPISIIFFIIREVASAYIPIVAGDFNQASQGRVKGRS